MTKYTASPRALPEGSGVVLRHVDTLACGRLHGAAIPSGPLSRRRLRCPGQMPTTIAGRFVSFVLIGGAATGTQYAIAALLHLFAGVPLVASSTIGFIVSAIGNYVLNARWTFGSAAADPRQALRFAVGTISGCVVNGVVLDLLLAWQWHAVGAQLAATVIVLAWNFTLGSLWVYRRNELPN